MQRIDIGCLNIHGTHVTTPNSTTNNVVFFFVSDLKIVNYKQLLILDHNGLDKRGKMFCVKTYLETKSLKTVSKLM